MAVDFGIVLQPGWRPLDPPDILTFNRRAIAMLSPEFTTLWTEDHFQKGTSPALEAWTTLSFIAAEFPQYRLGNLVLSQSYRNPAMLAKMSATLQYLSGGRLTLGIGAGWQEDEYHAYGYRFPGPGVRIAQLTEAIEILHVMWTQSPATYHGTHYHIDGAYCEPRPHPIPRIVVGAEGEKILKVVARLADGWNTGLPIDVFTQRQSLLRHYCEELGRDLGEIAISIYAHAYFPGDATDFAERAANLLSGGVLLLGPTPQDAIAALQPYAVAGVSHFTVKPHSLATLERFCAEVAPTLASALGAS